jgi:hypothetical protein
MSSNRFRFGLFEFDPALRELRREGILVRLQSQLAQVLSCLLEHSGRVVSREELRSAVWRGETYVDFDRGLNFCVAQIRSALDDDSVTPALSALSPNGATSSSPPSSASARAQTIPIPSPRKANLLLQSRPQFALARCSYRSP